MLFVCAGNVCRSAYAELLGRHLYPDPPLRITSAGVGALVGRTIDDDMAAELKLRGARHEDFAARQLTRTMVARADVVLTLSRRHRELVVRECPEAVWRVFVLGQFNRISAAVPDDVSGRELVAALRSAHLPPVPEDDVPDPRGRGREAASSAAIRLEDEVRAALGRLAGQMVV